MWEKYYQNYHKNIFDLISIVLETEHQCNRCSIKVVAFWSRDIFNYIQGQVDRWSEIGAKPSPPAPSICWEVFDRVR